MSRSVDRVILDCRLATMAALEGYGAIEDAAIIIDNGRIAWAGLRAELPSVEPQVVDRCGGRWVTPGLIDCHTHLLFGGNRAAEFEMRLQGMDYREIALNGGGIASTVRATNDLGIDDLIAAALPRLDALRRDGVTTVEIKSGYALDLDGELKMLRAARELGRREGIRVRTTFLGLHALPAAYAGRQDTYVDEVIGLFLPVIAAENLADAVDAYVEPIAFTVEQARRFFAAAAKAGFPVKLHADQLSAGGGAGLAAEAQALSADHLEYSTEADVAAMAVAGVVAVLLPGAYLILRETQLPPVEALRRHGVAMAVATDCNPGTSPMPSLLLAMSLACTLFRLTPAEALAGTTRNAAKALGLQHEIGTVAAGFAADLAVWDVETPAELSYWLGMPLLHRTYVAGRPIDPVVRRP